MARRPLIGITCSVGSSPTGAARVQLNQSYERAIREAGGLPVLLAPGLDSDALDQITGELQGLLLPGGLDVDPVRYRAARHPMTEVNAGLDELEFPLTERALRSGLPVLAICRGIQLLNVACGGSLWQDVPSEHPTDLTHLQKQVPRDHLAHGLRLAADSRLAHVLGQTELPVNSFHHQALRAMGEGLQPVGWAEDGTVEAVEGPGPFVIGVQCHPDELVQSQPTWRRLFTAFVDAANNAG
ncbi:MAG: gamma-glutamyl-gamma-aminobutyrate hydrolase family protein [Chloroflexota bacterium]